MEWNWLDAALAVIVFASVAAAMWEGFIREMISIASMVAGVVIAALGYRQAGSWFRGHTSSPEVTLGLGFLALFFGTLIAGALVSILARRIVQKAGLQWFDRFLGGLFGLVRGFVICSVLLMAMVAFSIKTPAVQGSTLAPFVILGARMIGAAMPYDLKTLFEKGQEKFRQALIERDKAKSGK